MPLRTKRLPKIQREGAAANQTHPIFSFSYLVLVYIQMYNLGSSFSQSLSMKEGGSWF
jgi:hypothetical protein